MPINSNKPVDQKIFQTRTRPYHQNRQNPSTSRLQLISSSRNSQIYRTNPNYSLDLIHRDSVFSTLSVYSDESSVGGSKNDHSIISIPENGDQFQISAATPGQNNLSQRPTNHSSDYTLPPKITEPKLKFDLKKFLKWSSICLFLGFIAHCQLTYDGVANEDWSWVGDLLENDEVDIQNYLGKKMVREDSNLIAQKLIVDLSVYDFVDVVKNDTKLFESSIT